MGRPTTVQGLAPTTERLLDAAEAEFAVAGFDGATLEAIAARAGIRRPSLLHHFATKEALYEATVRRVFDALGIALAPALGIPDDFELTVECLVAAYQQFLAERPTFAPLVLREVIDGRGPGREFLLTVIAPLLDQLEALVARQRRPALPLRAAILQVACAPLVRSAWGPLGDRLWGPGPDATRDLARALLLPEGR
jgi:AcrR family transcriptional regulator